MNFACKLVFTLAFAGILAGFWASFLQFENFAYPQVAGYAIALTLTLFCGVIVYYIWEDAP